MIYPLKMMSVSRLGCLLSTTLFLFNFPLAFALDGTVIDTKTQKPLPDALVTLNDTVVTTDAKGHYHFDDAHTNTDAAELHILARAIGYNRTSTTVKKGATQITNLELSPQRVNGLYLSFYGIGSKTLRNSALTLIKNTQLNALVIDVKGDKGMIPYRSDIAMASSIGARDITTVHDMRSQIKDLHDQGIYLIARIVTFKDNLLAKAKPNLAVHKSDGSLFTDLEGLAWTDASQKEVWQYNIDIAIEAASLGFDEIQFDYMRFPDHTGLVFNMENTQKNRVASITGFLAAAHQQLKPYNVFMSGDIFGYVPWNENDTYIGQTLDGVLENLDYVCPMLYPSGFKFGIPQYRNPVAEPYAIVHNTIEQAVKRSKVSSLRYRPWLQAFRDYAFDRRIFTGSEIQNQIKAADDAGTSGWMLWNPRNAYTEAGLTAKSPAVAVDAAL